MGPAVHSPCVHSPCVYSPLAAGTLEREVKFEAQLYKMRDGEYSLDFQVGCCLQTLSVHGVCRTRCRMGSIRLISRWAAILWIFPTRVDTRKSELGRLQDWVCICWSLLALHAL